MQQTHAGWVFAPRGPKGVTPRWLGTRPKDYQEPNIFTADWRYGEREEIKNWSTCERCEIIRPVLHAPSAGQFCHGRRIKLETSSQNGIGARTPAVVMTPAHWNFIHYLHVDATWLLHAPAARANYVCCVMRKKCHPMLTTRRLGILQLIGKRAGKGERAFTALLQKEYKSLQSNTVSDAAFFGALSRRLL